jgi:DNA-binding MarR family transcriptional regulator
MGTAPRSTLATGERRTSPGRAGKPDLSDEVGDLLHRVNRRIRAVANLDLEPLGITSAQARALRTLARSDGPIRMSELADRLRVARRSATSVIDELAERGLVDRRADPSDRRAVDVEVTPAGWSMLDRIDAHRRRAAARVTRGLDRRDLVALRDLLRRLDPD